MDPALFRKTPPPLSPNWLAHEKAANLLAPQPVIPEAIDRQRGYSQRCKALNAELLGGRDKHLTSGFTVTDSLLPPSLSDGYSIPIRCYNPSSKPLVPPITPKKSSVEEQKTGPVVIYYHGGGLYVGDLDSEDMTCRRICKELECTVYSVDYRLMPQNSADDALADAEEAFKQLTANKTPSHLILVGSSSGGQLAAQVSQIYARPRNESLQSDPRTKVHGVLLRGPVTCDATDEGKSLPPRWKDKHFSMSTDFHTSLLSNAAVNASNRTIAPLPLEVESLSGLPRHWIQVSSNDVYYADGVCYAAALKEAGIEVQLDVVEGYPHTFWLKCPYLDRAVQAEDEMLKGLKWLLGAGRQDSELQ